MNLQQIDYTIIGVYLIAVYVLAVKAWYKLRLIRASSPSYISAQYLAGNDISTFQATCSLVAAEVSAITFFSLPLVVFNFNFSALQFSIGAMIGRLITSKLSIDLLYGKGVTFFEILSNIIPRSEDKKGRQILALFYVIFKLGGVGIKLFTGAVIVSKFFDFSLFDSISLIMALTFIYTLVGGLKAVVYTDVMQLFVLLLGVVFAHVEFVALAGKPWLELMSMGAAAGKISLFSPNQSMISALAAVTLGLVSGFFLTVSDQESLQKLLGARTKKSAKRALQYSSVLVIFVRLMVLTLGVLIWCYYQDHDVANVSLEHLFEDYVIALFPSPLKGLVVASVLAATMSTLDSGLNAISACFWNDLASHREVQNFKVYVATDNFIIAMLITMVAYSGMKSQLFITAFSSMGEYVTPVMATLFMWAVLSKTWIPISLGRFNSLLLLGSCLCGALVTQLNGLGDWKVVLGLILGLLGLKTSIKIGKMISKK